MRPMSGSCVHGEIAAVALAIDRALGMGRPQLAALCDGLAVRPDQPLRQIKTAAVALGQAEHGGELCLAYGVAQPLGLRTVIGQRIVEIALHEAAADRPGRRVHPDVPGVAGDEGLRKGDQLGALLGRVPDQRDRLVDRGVEIQPGGRRLHHRDLVFRMFDAHSRLHCRLIGSHVRCSLFGQATRPGARPRWNKNSTGRDRRRVRDLPSVWLDLRQHAVCRM